MSKYEMFSFLFLVWVGGGGGGKPSPSHKSSMVCPLFKSLEWHKKMLNTRIYWKEVYIFKHLNL